MWKFSFFKHKPPTMPEKSLLAFLFFFYMPLCYQLADICCLSAAIGTCCRV